MTLELTSSPQITAESASASVSEQALHQSAVDVRFETPAQAKQRRRRTSPRDYAILEAAYQRNTKPDKHDRTQLVRQVNLGEKEVQIWFQNRRQNDRRKSKPLLPHELIPHFRNGVPSEATQRLESPESSPESTKEREDGSCGDDELHLQKDSPVAAASDAFVPCPKTSVVHNGAVNESSGKQAEMAQDSSSPRHRSDIVPSTSSADGDNIAATSAVGQPSFSRKRSHEEMNSVPPPLSPEHGVLSTNAKQPLTRSSSMRLSMMADGAVKVRLNSEPTPSPPKKQPNAEISSTRRSSGFTRSQSAIEGDLAFKDAPTASQRTLGRSRDARTWEFFCDREAQDALAMRAEEDGTGSAVGAINLMRSGSQKKSQPLTANKKKQNSRRPNAHASSKPVLVRSYSSLPRLQGIEKHVDRHERAPKKHCWVGSGSDSDKENWIPGGRRSVHVQRDNTQVSKDNVLQENLPGSSLPLSDIVAQVSSRDQENLIAMTSGRDKAKGDDLDCIQGLLSLSQGAWR